MIKKDTIKFMSNFGSMLPRKLCKFKLPFIFNITLQEFLQDPQIDVVPPITTICH